MPPKPPTGDPEYGALIKAARLSLGLNQTEFGKRFGVGQGAVGQWETGLTMPSQKHAAALTRLGVPWPGTSPEDITRSVPPEERMDLPPPNARLAPTAPALPVQATLDRDVPILGTAWGGPNDQFVLSERIGFAPRPPALYGRPNVFAVYLDGNSMVPWKEPGELLYAERGRPVRPGDYVLVELIATGPIDGEHGGLIKRLVKLNSEFVVLEQFLPPRADIKIMRRAIKGISRVLDISDLIGS